MLNNRYGDVGVTEYGSSTEIHGATLPGSLNLAGASS